MKRGDVSIHVQCINSGDSMTETADIRYQEEHGRSIADHGITLSPGDAVYVDLNGDGK